MEHFHSSKLILIGFIWLNYCLQSLQPVTRRVKLSNHTLYQYEFIIIIHLYTFFISSVLCLSNLPCIPGVISNLLRYFTMCSSFSDGELPQTI